MKDNHPESGRPCHYPMPAEDGSLHSCGAQAACSSLADELDELQAPGDRGLEAQASGGGHHTAA